MKNRVHKLNENDTELLSTDKAEIHPFSSRPPRKIFEEVYHKSIQLGLKPEDFRHLSGIREIQKSVKRVHYVGFFLFALKIIPTNVLYMVYLVHILTKSTFNWWVYRFYDTLWYIGNTWFF
jgi:hypothetical protein